MADEQSTTLAPAPVAPNTYLPLAGENLLPGAPLTQSLSVAGTVGKAKADSANTASCVGLAAVPGVSGHHVHCQYGGPLTLTTAQWDAVAVDAGAGLEVGVKYYLSALTGGKITKTAPSEGNFLTPIGIATSPETLLIQLSLPTPS